MRIRGAPAIGLAAAYGILLAVENELRSAAHDPPDHYFDHDEEIARPGGVEIGAPVVRKKFMQAKKVIANTRPTAINLFWSMERMEEALDRGSPDPLEACARLAREAFIIHDEELETEFAIGRNGSGYLRDGMRVLTHCNAGGLATAGYGTALGVIASAHEEGKRLRVYVDETRPLLQGARLTAWELGRRGIDTTLLCDGAAASLIAARRIDAVIVGADRIAANGDSANKIGTLGLAVLCDAFDTPFYIAAPLSTFDPAVESGSMIPIEERDGSEVSSFAGVRTAPRGVAVYNPAFDVTPARLITAIITERGAVERPDAERLRPLRGPSG
jgi:methylthioribose-1-phosphate isomerase